LKHYEGIQELGATETKLYFRANTAKAENELYVTNFDFQHQVLLIMRIETIKKQRNSIISLTSR
jgi:hypothetical protein